MTNQGLINLAKDYIVLGTVVVGIGILVFLFIHIFGRNKQISHNWKWYFRKVIGASFVMYIIVVVGATLIRVNYGFDMAFHFRLFSSYKMAWNSGSYIEWRNLILNILMFVPLGIYLPVLFVKFRKYYLVYGVGFLCSLGIEVTQVLLKRGVGEIDDLYNNTLGTVIGYGIFVCFYGMISRKKENPKMKASKLIFLQIPLIMTITILTALFFIYHGQEYGNLFCENTYRIKMKDVSISTDLELGESSGSASVYKVKTYTTEELKDKGNALFAQFHTTIDEDETIEYEDLVVFYSEKGNYDLWMDYQGGGYWFINHDINNEGPDISMSEDEIKQDLLDVEIEVPETAEYVSLYSEQESGGNVFHVEPIVNDNGMIMGTLSCDMNENGNIMQLRNYIYEYTYVNKCEIYSEQEIYDRIVAGEFSCYGVYELENLDMIVKSMELSYALDSKGFYQPVYKVAVQNREDVMQLMLPAMK